MKLVLLEALIVLIAWRAVMSLLGHAPPWPTPLWDFFAGLALVATLSIAIDALRKRFARPAPPAASPRIPLDRIGPFELEKMPVRFGASGEHHINLN